jgi:hypothetical protein
MKSENPPRLAAWLLEHFGSQLNHDALAGDLWEAFKHGRSKGWYWRQVLAAIRWRSLFYRLLFPIAAGWGMSLPGMWRHSPLVSRPLDWAIFTAFFLACGFLPDLLRRKLRILLSALILTFLCWLYRYHFEIADHYMTFGVVGASCLALKRKAVPPAPYHLTLRELLNGDPEAERNRLIERLHLTMMLEQDPELRQVYLRSIIALEQRVPGSEDRRLNN